MKRSQLKRTRFKQKPPKKTKERWDKDKEFYLGIWQKSNKRCQISGRYLGNEPLTTFFHHILPKSKFPQYRYAEWNVIMLAPEIHEQIELDMDKVAGFRKIYDDLISKHERGQFENTDE